jgi:hypothetical protein
MARQEHGLEQTSQSPFEQPGDRQPQFISAARARWQTLGQELTADAAALNSQHSGAEFLQDADDRFRVTNRNAGLELILTADFDNRTVRYNYAAINDRTAGVPEGGILAMRPCPGGSVEFYSADKRLTSKETRQVLLEPMLPPRQSTS